VRPFAPEDAIPVLRQRLISGGLLTVTLIGLLLIDAYLATLESPGWRLPLPFGHQLDLGAWLLNGALSTLVVLIFAILTARELVRFFRAAGYRASGLAAQFFAAGFVLGPYLAFNLKHNAGYYDETWGMTWLAVAVAFFSASPRLVAYSARGSSSGAGIGAAGHSTGRSSAPAR